MVKQIKLVVCLALCLGFLVCWRAVGSPDFTARAQQANAVDFKRDIEPIFQARCYQCHSAKKVSAQLRLDNQKLALKGGVSGAVIVPGQSAASRLLHRVSGQGDEARMPLNGEPLTTAQIELLRRWIDQGAPWPDDGKAAEDAALPKHWAFVTPVRPPLPVVKNKAWVRTPIDQFILAQLEQRSLPTSPAAGRETLLRRLSLDLTGLPPTLKEVDDFLADASPQAYEKAVERLLASPHYGERWGRWWLDAARYADSNGFEKDRSRSIWPYRDWVIKAFNDDKPFDQFTIEQLAGDLLPDATIEQRVATGFLRNSMLNEEGGVDPEQFRVEGLLDRVDAIGKAFLGLTVACAQCHNHKFDPIAQREYYQFYAFLNSDDEPEIEAPDADVAKKRAEITAQINHIEDNLLTQTPDLPGRLAAWENEMKQYEGQWTVLEDTSIFASFGVKFDKLEDGSYIAKGDNSTANNYKVVARTKQPSITGFRLELLTDPNLPRTGPGRAADGSFYVSEFVVEAGGQSGQAEKIKLAAASADFALPTYKVSNLIDGNEKTHWSSDAGPGRRNQDRKLVFVPASPLNHAGGVTLNFQIISKFDETISWGKPNIGRFRLSVTSAANPQADPVPAAVRSLLAIPATKRTPEQQRLIFSFYRTTVPEWAAVNAKIDELLNGWPYGAVTLALAARPTPRQTHIFRRGDWKRPAEAVTPGTPAVLPPLPAAAPRNRLGLGRWIVDKNNPLTPRVIVNRIWQHYFGQGLVTTPEDFGARCEKPSHPDLLDWLAREFVDKGWSIKHIHRVIVHSATYRQSSKLTTQLQEVDPGNVLLARAPRQRVEAETIRDLALSASGLLSPKLGGPSVYPPIPDGVLSLGYGAPMKWETASGADRYRRAMYTFWKRAVPYPSLLVFDAPNADASCTRRISSNTPLQALTTLNDQMFMEAAQALALRAFKEAGADDRTKMIYAFRLCTGRRPDDWELKELLALLAEQQAYFKGRTAAAVYVSAADLSKLTEDVDLHQVAPWVMVARVLLNLDETITKE